MFNIGFTEMVVLGVLALIIIGPKQLPELARNLGRLINEFKRSTDGLKDEFKTQAGFNPEMKPEDLFKENAPKNQEPVKQKKEDPV
ncbi:MAG: Sec-independent protein translocase protein TatB [Pseudobdellovibrionaceae bacterium]